MEKSFMNPYKELLTYLYIPYLLKLLSYSIGRVEKVGR